MKYICKCSCLPFSSNISFDNGDYLALSEERLHHRACQGVIVLSTKTHIILTLSMLLISKGTQFLPSCQEWNSLSSWSIIKGCVFERQKQFFLIINHSY